MGREEQRAALRQPSDAVYGESGASALPRPFHGLRISRPPCGASSGACGSCGLPATHGGRLAAGAAHRAALRDCCRCRGCCHRSSSGQQVQGVSRCANVYPICSYTTIEEVKTYCRCVCCVSLHCIGILLPIVDFETFYYSPLRGNSAL